MFGFLKHIRQNTKILFFAFILILIPGAIISYLSLQSINQKAENLGSKYSGTVRLVRDKLESEILRLEANLRNNVIESFPESDNPVELKSWLQNLESDHPAFKYLFLVNINGGLISSSVSLGCHKHKQPGSRPLLNTRAATDFNMAENAEFIRKNLIEAINLYRKALSATKSSPERILVLSRIGRCYLKLGDYARAAKEYKKILELGDNDVTIGEVPSSVVALFQISECYEAMKAYKDKYNVVLQLYKQLLDQPWDISGGEYLYYLKSAEEGLQNMADSNVNVHSSEWNKKDLLIRGDRMLEHIKFIELIHQDILSEVESNLRNGSHSDSPSHNISLVEGDSTLQLGFNKLPPAFQQYQLLALGYQFESAYILSDLIPEILTTVELGKDVFVGILGGKDSLLYIQQNLPITNHLVAENFNQIYVSWQVALFDGTGKSIEQLTRNERVLYLILFTGIIFIMLIGIVFMVRAVIHESEVSRMKSEFVSNVSHELKTPLALIRMFGETLDEGIVTDEKKRREFYSIIRKESERLSHLINNVLDFSRMDTGAKEYYFEETDLVKVIKSSLEAYKFHIRQNGFEIESEFPDEAVMLKIDRDAISQALLNLFSNAVKYSEKRKYIKIEIGKNSSTAMISVTDRGIGISKKELNKIFDKFYRVPATGGEEKRGSGLGLTLVKKIVEAHGGTIEVESEVGKGSKFTLQIPLQGIK
jgi:signal transduction histidine kinase